MKALDTGNHKENIRYIGEVAEGGGQGRGTSADRKRVQDMSESTCGPATKSVSICSTTRLLYSIVVEQGLPRVGLV